MASKTQTYVIKGMQRDLSVSKFNPEFAYENYNIRITSRGNKNSLLSVSNEKGNKIVNNTSLNGIFIGGATLNNYVVLFTINKTNGNSEITRYDFSKPSIEKIILFSGNLGFNINNPIDTLSMYETDNIQKIYWIDGLNQPRVINIVSEDRDKWIEDSFNFTRKIIKNTYISANKIEDNSGVFSPGVIQYAYTLYNIFGSETNIIKVSDLIYLTNTNRGASPEEKVTTSIKINITINDNFAKSFDYCRLYSISRTSLNGNPVVKRVTDIKIGDNLPDISVYDNGTLGEFVDPTMLLYIGGRSIIPNAFSQKDNTLFLGNYSISNLDLPEDIENELKQTKILNSGITGGKFIQLPDINGNYPYINQIANSKYNYTDKDIKYFKSGNYYRFGIQFQNSTGEWGNPIYIDDIKVDLDIRPKPIITSYNSTIDLPFFKATINSKLIDKVLNHNPDFVKVRPIVVYPSENERETICQGIVCPTVFNVKDRKENNPFVQSSWFSRPQLHPDLEKNCYDTSYELTSQTGINIYNFGTPIVSSSYFPIPSNDRIGAEIQLIRTAGDLYDENIALQESPKDYNYYIDGSIFTFHSPDAVNINYNNTNFRIVGIAPISSNQSFYSIQSDQLFSSTESKLNKQDIGTINPSFYGGTILGAKNLWRDKIYNWNSTTGDIQNFIIYPWHRNGSLNNGVIPSEGEIRKSVLKYKKSSNLRYSYVNEYLQGNLYSPINGITTPLYCDSETNPSGFVKINDLKNYPIPDLIYKWDVDKVLISSEDYYIYYGEDDLRKINYKNLAGKTSNSNSIYGKDPVSIKYKSDSHLVVALNPLINDFGERELEILPCDNIYSAGFIDSSFSNFKKRSLFWEDNLQSKSVSTHQEIIEIPNIDEQAYFWVGEIYRDVNKNNVFGGNSKDALKNNIWVPCGNEIRLTKGSNALLEFIEGDTYYQRYDCLKTYPYTLEDQNSITDIVSFMCETYTNIDGRYDKNRGKKDNLAVSPINFNLFNTVYNQKNNFFSSRILDKELFKNINFKNNIVWSKQKTLGELIDTWTNITLSSNLDMDGDKGFVNSIIKLNNELFAFQDKAISKILFNSRVQIPTSESVPIEISNSYKVDGKIYLSNTIGCQNKWSIVNTPNGVYFIDNLTNSLYRFNGQQLDPLSDKLGFRTFIEDQNINTQRTIDNKSNFKSFYDSTNGDVYFINKNYCLSYSELLNQFVSFYSYENIPYMFNTFGSFYSIDQDSNYIWKHEDGDYNYFYDKYKPYSISIIGNPDYQLDKIYNTIDYRADIFDINNKLLENETFTDFIIEDNYQKAIINLTYNPNAISNLKRRFRTWRLQIPRSQLPGRGNGIDRIRNNWAKFTLINNNQNDKNRVELHDINLNYFV